MYRWSKFADLRWTQDHESELQARSGGALAVIQRADHPRVQLEICCRDHRAAKSLLTQFGGKMERLPQDWLEHFSRKQKAPSLKIGRRLVITKSGGFQTAGAIRKLPLLVIPAAGAFGTGEHVTTAMCLRLLEEATRGWKQDWRMLDAGTGSGILALAGRCFGARDVLAIDNDPRAIAIAKENARANAIRGVRFVIGDAAKQIGRETFNLITANLFSELLIAALRRWKTRLRKDGYMIVSGVLRGQEREFRRALRQNGFQISVVRRRGKWVAFLCHPQRSRGLPK